MTVTPIRKAGEAEKDPLRVALATAIAAAHEAETAVTQQRSAVSRAEAHLAKAELDLQTATVTVAAAKVSDAAAVAAAIHTAAAIGAPTAAREARAAEQEAQDAVDVATAALAKLNADLSDLEEAARLKRNAVAVAVNDVLTPVVEGYLAAAEDYKSRLAVCMATIGLILDEAMQRGAPLAGLREKHERVAALTAIDVAGDALPAALAAWREAIAALKADAAAALPQLEKVESL